MTDNAAFKDAFASEPPPSGLDIYIRVTAFRDESAKVKTENEVTLREIIPHLRDTRARIKEELPWLKLATFGSFSTKKKCLRNNANVTAIYGVEGDYDGGQITLERARQILTNAGLAAILYTSPSHTPVCPRWRVLCPTSRPLLSSERAGLLANLNGLFVGALSPESFTLAQSYYFGTVESAPDHTVIAIDGKPIDLAPELDAGAIGRPKPTPNPEAKNPDGTPIPPLDGEATPYGLRALENECEAVRNAADGGKHHAINKAGFSIGGLVGSNQIDEEFARKALTEALEFIRHRCKNFTHAQRTLEQSFQDGLAKPRDVPPRSNGFGIPEGDGADPLDADDWTDAPVPPRSAKPPLELPATPFAAGLLAGLKPRQWVYGHFLIERFLSVLGAPGGTGKSAYGLSVAISVALNRALMGETVHKAGPVWVYNLEDPQDEALRRVWATCLHHGVNPAELEGRLYLDSGRDRPLVVAERNRAGDTIALPVVDALIAELQAREIRLLVVDPFVKTHRLEENRNEQVDFAATLWNRVADQAGCAIMLMHHFRKGGESGSADAFRGASALIDASRAAVTLAVMSEKEANTFGVEPDQRRFLIRADNAKLNLAPPPTRAVWLKLNSVELPNTDFVQAVSRWDPPSPWEGIPMELVVQMVERIGAGRGDGQFWSPDTRAKANWAGQVIIEDAFKTKELAATIIKAWMESGLLKEEEYHDPARREKRMRVVVDTSMLQEMRNQMRTEANEND